MIRYFAADAKLYPWDPHDPEDCLPGDCEYFRQVFLAMEDRLGAQAPPLRVFLTGRSDRLPEYGEDIIAVVTADECGRPPLYAQDVGMTFKCYGTSPDWEAHTFGLDSLTRGRLANSLRSVARSVPYRGWTGTRSLLRRLSGRPVRPTYEIPLGYNDQQADLPLKPIEDREIDVFFAGTVPPRPTSPFSARWWVPRPKQESRRRMVEQIREFNREHPSVTCELVTPSTADSDAFLSPDEYSELLMNSKICIVPRGNNVETWRLFEAARFGCVIVSEKLPKRWYYEEFPSFEIEKWKEVDKILKKIIGRKEKIKKLHKDVKKWWDERCSEEPVGAYMARKVKKNYGAGVR